MNGLRGLNGAMRPHLYTAETRLSDAIVEAREIAPHNQVAFCGVLMAKAGISMADASMHWRLWRAEVNGARFSEHVTMWTGENGSAMYRSEPIA